MGTGPQACPVDARRFAALLAGFDIGNASEEEAISKGRAMRRMAANANMRFVDLLEHPDVRKAIDTQMQPARQESPDLQEALERAAALQEEVTERTRDVRQLADMLRQEREAAQELRQELASSNPGARAFSNSVSPRAFVPAAPIFGAQSWAIEAGAALLTVVLLIAAVCGGTFYERRNGNGHGSGKRNPAPVVRKGGAVHPFPEHGAVHHRLHSGGPTPRTR